MRARSDLETIRRSAALTAIGAATLSTAFLALTALSGHAQAQTTGESTVGVTGAVNKDAFGKPVTLPRRTLTVGLDVFLNEHVITEDNGEAQLLFKDGSALTLGPNCDEVLDNYDYDPGSTTGKAALSVVRGAVRFVGGRISKNYEVTVKTPVGEVGIRGGIGLIYVDPANGATTGIFIYGDEMRIRGQDGKDVIITRSGFSSTIPGPGQAAELPIRVRQDLLAKFASLEGRAGANGGAVVVPTEAAVVSAPVTTTIASAASSTATQTSTVSQAQSQQTNPVASSTTEVVQNVPVQSGTSTSQPTPPTSGTSNTYAVQNDEDLDPSIPFLPPTGVSIASGTVSPLYLYAANGSLSGTAPVPVLQFSFGVSGSGASQQSVASLLTGSISDGALTGNVAGSSVTSGSSGPTFYAGTVAASLEGSALPTGFSFTETINLQPGSGGGNAVTPGTALGTRSAATFNGYAGAIDFRTTQSSGLGQAAPSIATSSGPSLTITTDPKSSTVAVDMPLQDPTGGSVADLKFGGGNNRSSYLDNSLYGALDSEDGEGAPLSTIGGTTASSSVGYFLPVGVDGPTSLLPAGDSYCDCQYATWGFFGGTLANQGDSQSDTIHLGTWVAGSLVDPSLIPTTGTATYNGHVVGTVAETGITSGVTTTYLAGGGLDASFDFGTRSGTVKLVDFDGSDYQASVSAGNHRDFSGALKGGGGASGVLSGSFYGDKGNPAAEIGGQFAFEKIVQLSGQQAQYIASGIFLGKK